MFEEQIRRLFQNPQVSSIHADICINNSGSKKGLSVCGTGKIEEYLTINVLPDRVSCFRNKEVNKGVDFNKHYGNTIDNEYDAVYWALSQWLFTNKGLQLD